MYIFIKLVNYIKGDSMYYLNIFFLFSFLGHILENIIYTKVDSGILYGLWTPIYGFGVIFIILINNFLKKFNFNVFFRGFLLFLSSAIILAIIETLGGYFIEIVYGRIFWIYNLHFISLGKYTSIQMMVLWGISSILVIFLIIPIVDKFIHKIPKYLTYFFIYIFIYDIFYTYMRLGNFL